MSSIQEDAVLVAVEQALGRVTLNRPRSINALTLEMVRAIDAALDRFEQDAAVRVVLFDGAGERGFCAGGDIVGLHDSARDGDRVAYDFWREEYALNARIARFPKPIVAAMDGVVMGGGIGLAGHASHRVATERLLSAMPEVGIGFAPDVGGTWLLSRAPGELGTHLTLTGARLGEADALLVGFADCHVPSDALPALVADLRDGDADAALAAHAQPPAQEAPLQADRAWIDAAYAHDTVEQILAALRARPEQGAAKAVKALERNSPTSLKVALRALRRARELPTLEACLEQEYRVSIAFLTCPDFVEGIRAQVIDKDRNPRWRPARLEDVEEAAVDRFFAPVEVMP